MIIIYRQSKAIAKEFSGTLDKGKIVIVNSVYP
jgi:hypothetical protein